MAIYHLSVKPISRTTGRSAVAAAAYRAGIALVDERTGRLYDYSPRTNVGSIAEPAYIVAPDGLGEVAWIHDPATLWNRAEKEAKRKDAKTAREIEIAIPAELNEQEASDFCRAMARWTANRFGVAVHVSRHVPSPDGDARNRHVHMQLTTRQVAADGFGARTAELDNKHSGAIGEIRKQAADLMNDALEQAGSTARVDHRSFVDQGREDLPGIHLGAAASMERKGTMTEIGDRHRARQAANAELAAARIELNQINQELRAARIAEMAFIPENPRDRRPSPSVRPRAIDVMALFGVEPAAPLQPAAVPSPRAPAHRRRIDARPRLERVPEQQPTQTVPAAPVAALAVDQPAPPRAASPANQVAERPAHRRRRKALVAPVHPVAAQEAAPGPAKPPSVPVTAQEAAPGPAKPPSVPVTAQEAAPGPAVPPSAPLRPVVPQEAPRAPDALPQHMRDSYAAADKLLAASRARAAAAPPGPEATARSLFGQHPQAEAWAAAYFRAAPADEAEPSPLYRRIADFAEEALGVRLWDHLVAAVSAWQHHSAAGAAAVAKWITRAPALPDAILRDVNPAATIRSPTRAPEPKLRKKTEIER